MQIFFNDMAKYVQHLSCSFCDQKFLVILLYVALIWDRHLWQKCPITSKSVPKFLKSKLNQKPQFPPTLLPNFWYFTISRHGFNGNWLNFGQSPPQKTFRLLDHCESVRYHSRLLWFHGKYPSKSFKTLGYNLQYFQ